MPVFLDTRGNSSLAIGVCGRCSQKFPIGELHPDPNYPGLMVCAKDRDNFDPYRLPARQPENIALRFARPDTPVGLQPTTPWILATGFWNDFGRWVDTATWLDSPPIPGFESYEFALMDD